MTTKGKVVAFGEVLLRLSPVGTQRIVRAESLEINYGGS
ncbi:MAG: sugar kinase, partial [Bacteroidota bacterium]